jgi:tRNA-specific 2-thiouridylase
MNAHNDILSAVRTAMDLPGNPRDHRVVVAMSGGVDSSCVAGLIMEAGYEAVGITLQLYDHGTANGRRGSCCAGADIHDARRVAGELGMPHYVLDYEARFRTAVVDEFAASYARGETPVPCVRCNQTVKFDDLIRQARELGAKALVTGHYAASRARSDGSGHRDLLTSNDAARDQSYFLYATTQSQLDYLRFPLAAFNKQQTRAIATKLGLTVATKPDSQDICFVPDGRYRDLIRRLRPDAASPGEVVHVDGRLLGHHNGIIDFTVGQRRGVGIAEGEPLYVVSLDAQTRRVVVGPREALRCAKIHLRDVNWLGREDLPSVHGAEVHVRIRSMRAPVPAMLVENEGGVAVVLHEEEHGVAPGQACVFYERPGAGARVLGGGTIVRAPSEGLRNLASRQANIALETFPNVTI